MAAPPAASPRIATVPAPNTNRRRRLMRADSACRACARASSRAARAPGLRRDTRMRCPKELVVQRATVVGLAQLSGDLEDDYALHVDEDGAGRGIDLIRVSQACRLVEDARVRHLELVAIDASLILAIPDVDPNNLEAATLIVAGDAVETGLLGPAGAAPRCPEVEEQRLAAEVFQRDAVAVEIGPDPVRGLVSHGDLALIRLGEGLLQAAGAEQGQAETEPQQARGTSQTGGHWALA